MSKVAQQGFVLHGRWDMARLFKLLPFMGQILCLAAQSAPLRVYRSGKRVFPKVAEAERSSKERLTEGGGDSRPMSGVFSQRGFWKFAFWLLGKEDTHGNRGHVPCFAGEGLWWCHGTEHTHPQNYRIGSVSLKAFPTGQVDPPFSRQGHKASVIFLRLSTSLTQKGPHWIVSSHLKIDPQENPPPRSIRTAKLQKWRWNEDKV